jgi:hypothetical protein
MWLQRYEPIAGDREGQRPAPRPDVPRFGADRIYCPYALNRDLRNGRVPNAEVITPLRATVVVKHDRKPEFTFDKPTRAILYAHWLR